MKFSFMLCLFAVAALTVGGCGKKEEAITPITQGTPLNGITPTSTGAPASDNRGLAISANPNLSPAQKQAAYSQLYNEQSKKK